MTPATPDLVRLLDGIDGWLTAVEAQKLYELARACTGRGAIVEIGSWKGRSTIALAAGARDGGAGVPVYAIDPHTGSAEHHEQFGVVDTAEEFRRNIAAAGVAEFVRPLITTSLEAAAEFDSPVELLFIDGDHTYEGARADVEAWFPKLIPGGVIAIHDVFVYQGGPRRVIRKHLMGHVSEVGFAYSVFHARKQQPPSPGQRARAWLALVVRNLSERYHLRRRFRTG